MRACMDFKSMMTKNRAITVVTVVVVAACLLYSYLTL